MSSQRGAGLTRKRAQKHKNSFAFKNDLHDKTPQMKKMNALNVCEVCERCKAQIEWKIKYKKYKPLSQAKTCIKWVLRIGIRLGREKWPNFDFVFRRCNQRTVKKAYHVCCKDCAKKARICAKCMTSADEVSIEPPEPTPQEAQQLQVEMDRLIKSLSERKRRTFQRFMKKGKEVENAEGVADKEAADTTAGEEKTEDGEAVKKRYVPHNRETLLNKIESLKLADEDEDDDDFSFDDSDLGSDEDDHDEDDECEEGAWKRTYFFMWNVKQIIFEGEIEKRNGVFFCIDVRFFPSAEELSFKRNLIWSVLPKLYVGKKSASDSHCVRPIVYLFAIFFLPTIAADSVHAHEDRSKQTHGHGASDSWANVKKRALIHAFRYFTPSQRSMLSVLESGDARLYEWQWQLLRLLSAKKKKMHVRFSSATKATCVSV